MSIDRYTKAVLTVIAVCLVWLCVVLTPVGVPLTAQGGPQQVVIAGWVERGGNSLGLHTSPLPVRLMGNPSADAGVPGPAPAPLMATPAATPRSAPSNVGGRCAATTQKGTQCSRMAKPGSSYCWQHAR